MGYDCYLVDKNKKVITLDEIFDRSGGIYAIGGSKEAWLYITYNYSPIFQKVLGFSLSDLDGKCVKDTLEDLENAIGLLSEDDKTDNYWDSTEYNVKKALQDLIYLGKHDPDAFWYIC